MAWMARLYSRQFSIANATGSSSCSARSGLRYRTLPTNTATVPSELMRQGISPNCWGRTFLQQDLLTSSTQQLASPSGISFLRARSARTGLALMNAYPHATTGFVQGNANYIVSNGESTTRARHDFLRRPALGQGHDSSAGAQLQILSSPTLFRAPSDGRQPVAAGPTRPPASIHPYLPLDAKSMRP